MAGDVVLLGVMVGVGTVLFLLLVGCGVWFCRYQLLKRKRLETVSKERIEFRTVQPTTKASLLTRPEPRPGTWKRHQTRRLPAAGTYAHSLSSGSSRTSSPQPESDSTASLKTSTPKTYYWREKRKMWRSEPMISSAVSPAVSTGLTSTFVDPPPVRNPRGSVQYALRYSTKGSLLVVTVIRGHNLLAVPRVGTDSYVKLYMLPDWKYVQRKTATVMNDRHPNFNETFKFKRGIKELEDSELVLRTFNADKLARNHFIGEIRLPLRGFDFQGLDIAEWGNLECFVNRDACTVEIGVNVKYSSETTSLNITVHKVLQTDASSVGSFADAYVSCCLFHKQTPQYKDTTQRVQSSGTAVFNYTFSFSVTYHQPREISILLQLKDSSRPQLDRLVGRLVLGCFGETDGAKQHVMQALDYPDTEIFQRHMLLSEW